MHHFIIKQIQPILNLIQANIGEWESFFAAFLI